MSLGYVFLVARLVHDSIVEIIWWSIRGYPLITKFYIFSKMYFSIDQLASPPQLLSKYRGIEIPKAKNTVSSEIRMPRAFSFWKICFQSGLYGQMTIQKPF